MSGLGNKGKGKGKGNLFLYWPCRRGCIGVPTAASALRMLARTVPDLLLEVWPPAVGIGRRT